MTPYEMEQQLKNLTARTSAIEQILPTLATRDDLRLATAALQYEMEAGFQDAKSRADRHEEQIRAITHQMVTRADLQDLRGEMVAMKGELRSEMATKGDLKELRGEMIALNGEVRGDIRALSKQIATLRAPRRKKR